MKMIVVSTVLILAVIAMAASAAVKGEEVTYSDGGVTMKGYLTYDDAVKGKRPGVLVVHEWWGHNEHARTKARKLAEMGYTALAVDMYGDGKTAAHPEDAGKFVAAVMQDTVAVSRFQAAMKLLQGNAHTDPQHIAAIGYCFGGAVVLAMARQGMDLDAVASFHGSLGTKTPAKAGAVKARVLVCNGAADTFVTPDEIAAFKKEMDDASVNYKFVNYEGAIHSFTNPQADEMGKKFNMPIAYNAEADTKSWAELQQFLKDAFAAK